MKGQHQYTEGVWVGEKVKKLLAPLCERVMVCGSVRRCRPVVGDVDVVAVPQEDKLAEAMKLLTQYGGSATAKVQATILLDDISVDVWFVPLESFGAALAFATGPMEENVRLRSLAKQQGLKLSQYGIFKRETGERLGGERESEVYSLLGEDWVDAWRRDVSSGRVSEQVNQALVTEACCQLDELSRRLQE